MTKDPKELYEGLAWKRDNEDVQDKWRKEKVTSLCKWFEEKGFFTPGQMRLGNNLLGEE